MGKVSWLLFSDDGLVLRVGLGLLVLAAFLALDVRRHGLRDSRRLREYGFLAVAALVALLYGLVNDCVTVRLSWEYFWFGKGLGEAVQYRVPVDLEVLQQQAVVMGATAASSAGLVFGIALVVANNPGRIGPPLRFRRMLWLLPVIAGGAALVAVAGACIGALGALDFAWPELFGDQAWIRPRPFATVWGAHLGAYLHEDLLRRRVGPSGPVGRARGA